jgi:hypothetical protein
VKSNNTVLVEILTQARSLNSLGKKGLAVFDLDSTLFDVSPRLQKILHDYAADPVHQKQFPESTKIVSQVETLKSDWGIKQSLIRAGLADHSSEFHHSVREFWIQHFFSNFYLQFDKPFEGAVEFVTSLENLGIEIMYLTGRDRAGMLSGTIETLTKWKFPLKEANLFLKPVKGMDDAQFKVDWFLSLPPEKYEQIWFFENEPVNVNLIRDHLKHVDIIFFESTHSGKSEPPSDLPKIFHYVMEEN